MIKRPCDTECPKCGSLEITRKYLAQNAIYRVPMYAAEYNSDTAHTKWNQRASEHTATAECIFNHCKTCNHNFTIEPLKPGDRQCQ